MKYHYISERELSFRRRTGATEYELEMIELRRALTHMHDAQNVANDDTPPLSDKGSAE